MKIFTLIISFLLSALLYAQTNSINGTIYPVLGDSTDLPNNLQSAGLFAGPVTYGVNYQDDIYFTQWKRFFKAIEGSDKIETVKEYPLDEEAIQFKIVDGHVYMIFDKYSTYANKIAIMDMPDLSSFAVKEYGAMTNGINKFEENNGYVYMAHNKERSPYHTISDKIIGADVLNNTEPTIVYQKDFLYFTMDGDIAYIITDDGTVNRTIEIVDFTDKRNFGKVGSIDVESANSLAYSNGYLFVACKNGQGMQVIDVQTPTAPVNVGNYGIGDMYPPSYSQIIIEGTKAFLKNGIVLTILDISTPSNPKYLNSDFLDDNMRSAQLMGIVNGKIYYENSGHFGIIEIARNNNFSLGEKYLSPAEVQIVKTDGENIVFYDNSGFYFCSLANNKFSPDSYDAFSPSVYPQDFTIDNDYLYVTDYDNLYTYQISNLSSTPLATYTYQGQYTAYKVEGNLAVVGGFMSNFDEYCEIIDLTDKTNPTQLYFGTDLIDGTIRDIEFSSNKDILYLTVTRMDGKKWFLIYDITDKTSPVKISEIELAGGDDLEIKIID